MQGVVVAEAGRKLRRLLIGIIGTLVLIVGVIAIPYPGPGWLIVFTGLAILATEFAWAGRVLQFAKGKYDAWESWLNKQKLWIKVAFWLLTAIIVVVTIWLLNGYGIINQLLGLNQDWVRSPLF